MTCLETTGQSHRVSVLLGLATLRLSPKSSQHTDAVPCAVFQECMVPLEWPTPSEGNLDLSTKFYPFLQEKATHFSPSCLKKSLSPAYSPREISSKRDARGTCRFTLKITKAWNVLWEDALRLGKFCFIFSPLFLACLQELGLQDSLLWGSNGEFRLSPLLLGSVIGTLWSGVGPMYLFIQSCVYIYMNLLILTLFFG